jgi:hypothetical protein
MLEIGTKTDALDRDLYCSLCGALVCCQAYAELLQQALPFSTCVLRYCTDAAESFVQSSRGCRVHCLDERLYRSA